MSDTIDLDGLSGAINDLIEKELLDKSKRVDEVMDRRGNQLRDMLQENSPEKTGEYASGWVTATVFEAGNRIIEISNKKRPDLTYILEMGRLTKDGRIVGKRPHIYQAVNQVIDDIMEDLISQL